MLSTLLELAGLAAIVAGVTVLAFVAGGSMVALGVALVAAGGAVVLVSYLLGRRT